MLKGISVWALKDNETRPAEELFAEARAHGFQGIEPAIGKKGLVTPESTEADCAELIEAAERQGIRITSLASGLGWRYPLTHDDEGVRRRGLELVRQSLRAASWLGVEVLLVVPGTLDCGDGEAHVPYDVAMERMKEGIGTLVPTAEETGVTLAIENVWNRVLLSPLEVRDFIDSFGSDRVGSYLDVGNMIVFGYAEDWIRILGPRVRCVHFKDYRRSAGTLEGFCALLEGDVDYPAVMRELRDVGYDGPCVAEFFRLEEDALAKLSAAMDRILAM
ncbi:MAG: sugar phosphate isomerase/epimerase family protein [Candidatus Brocadiaceae bacterium]|jgi:hexulose-6-phosphate isomerase